MCCVPGNDGHYEKPVDDLVLVAGSVIVGQEVEDAVEEKAEGHESTVKRIPLSVTFKKVGAPTVPLSVL
jgi:hypothetical protein